MDRSQEEFLKGLLARARKRARSAPNSANDGKKPTFRRLFSPSDTDDIRSGPGPDDRDPATLGGLMSHLMVNKGWDLDLATGTLRATWAQVAGADIAGHVQIETFEVGSSGQDGVLVLRADSTAWATQIRLLTSNLLEKVNASLDMARVSEIRVIGPTAPSWKHGRRSVPGRGPRDTYG